MSKKTFFNPVILLSGIGTPTDDSFDSDTTGQSGHIFPMAYGPDWLTMYGDEDFDGLDGEGTPGDYVAWWGDQDEALGFTSEKYFELNGVEWPTPPTP